MCAHKCLKWNVLCAFSIEVINQIGSVHAQLLQIKYVVYFDLTVKVINQIESVCACNRGKLNLLFCCDLTIKVIIQIEKCTCANVRS